MKYLKIAICFILAAGVMTSCFEDRDDNPVGSSEIKDFVWKGLNAFYLYKDDIADLANNRFANNSEYNSYLNEFSSPEALFDNLLYEPETIDRFSVLVNDYFALEQFFDGITKSNGMEFGLFRFSASDTDIHGYVRYVLPNTDAESKGVKRGDLFSSVNGTQLTISNWRSLLNPEVYTLDIAEYDDNGTPEVADDTLVPTGEMINLTKSQYTENPILTHSVLNVDGDNVGYLMYNAFTGTNEFNSELNSVFGEFRAAGVTNLILDLRYNGGGSVNTAIWLASMITGQHTGQTFFTEQYNSDLQSIISPEDLINPFVDQMIRRNSSGDVTFQETINHLNLEKVYILTTSSTASASELVINGLIPYINVVQIGRTTIGKYQASTTLYDSDNFGRANANPGHTYAMQPLIFKTVNANGVTDYFNGLPPTLDVRENIANLGVLGDVNETYLAAAIADIISFGRASYPLESVHEFKDSNDLKRFSKDMHTDKAIPDVGFNKIQFND